jgi:hypothetical protein
MVQTLYMASNAATLIATTLDGGAHGGHVGIIMLQALYSSTLRSTHIGVLSQQQLFPLH